MTRKACKLNRYQSEDLVEPNQSLLTQSHLCDYICPYVEWLGKLEAVPDINISKLCVIGNTVPSPMYPFWKVGKFGPK